jgi:hypothetical protein
MRAGSFDPGFRLMTISTWPTAVSSAVSRSTEKPTSVYRRSAETFGWFTPSTLAALLRQLALVEHLIERKGQPERR